MKNYRLTPLYVALVGLMAGPVAAQSLSDLYEAARGFDASYQSAKLQYDANLAKAEQARAAVLPSANLAMGVNRTHVTSNTSTFDRGSFGSQSATVSGSQQLYRPANRATAQQGPKLTQGPQQPPKVEQYPLSSLLQDSPRMPKPMDAPKVPLKPRHQPAPQANPHQVP